MVDLNELKEELGPSRKELMGEINNLAAGIAARDDYIAKLESAIKERDQIIEKLISKIKSGQKNPPKRVIVHRTQVQQQPAVPLMHVDLPRPEPEVTEREYLQNQLNKIGSYNPNTAAGTNWLSVWDKKRPKIKL